MSDIVRVLRVIEYTGPRDKVEDQVARSLHGEKRLPNGITIKAATVGSYPEILEGLPLVDGWNCIPPKKVYLKCPSCKHSHTQGELCGIWLKAHLTKDGSVPDEVCQCRS